MNKQTAAELTTEIRKLESEINAYTGKDFRLFTEQVADDVYEIKVFENNTDGTTSGGMITIMRLAELVTKFDINCIVRVEWKDGKGTKGCPYFLFF